MALFSRVRWLGPAAAWPCLCSGDARRVCQGLGGPQSDLSDGSSLSPLPVASEAFEDDNCSAFVSEDDSETQSLSSFSSGPTSPSEMPEQFPAAMRPASLDLPSPVSLSEFGVLFPGLGPRSECSGASSPECEVERGECSPLGGGEAGTTPGWMLRSGPL